MTDDLEARFAPFHAACEQQTREYREAVAAHERLRMGVTPDDMAPVPAWLFAIVVVTGVATMGAGVLWLALSVVDVVRGWW